MTQGVRLIFLGPPGAGKGTQAQVLAEICQIPHISTGEILRNAITQKTLLGQKAQKYVDGGELVPDELILDLIRERLSENDVQNGWILDGFPRNVSQAAFLDELLKELNQIAEYVVYLAVPDGILIERLLVRGRKDDNEDTIRRRLEVYLEQTKPVIDYYHDHGTLHTIDGNQTLEAVTQSLKQAIQI
jgi:adenylate kinase